MRTQIEMMHPNVLVSIGGDARRFVAKLSRDLRHWRTSARTRVDEARIGELTVRAVALAHPSMYPASAKGREFAGRYGVEADAALLHEACT